MSSADKVETSKADGAVRTGKTGATGFLGKTRETVSFVASLAAIVFSFNTIAFAAYHVPSESMLPTLTVGDHFYANKFVYGYSRFSTPLVTLPLPDGRLFGSLPDRGDVVVFSKPRTDETMVKRVVGLPGDRLQVKGGRLFINDAEVERREVGRVTYREHRGGVATVTEYEETLPGGRQHRIFERGDDEMADNTPVYTVPADHFFVMGDNRDNSIDSRFLTEVGYVPLTRLMGRVDRVNFSFAPCSPEADLVCPGGGFFDRLLKAVH